MSQAAAVEQDVATPRKVKIVGMDCGSCASTIENSMLHLDGVKEASVSFTTESMEVTGNVSMDEIASRLKDLGYRIANEADAASMALPQASGFKGFLHFLWAQPQLRSALIIIAAVLTGMLIVPAMGVPDVMDVPALTVMFGVAVIIAGIPVFIKGFRALIFARRITIDVLMAIAAFGAIAIGETVEAFDIMMLFILGEALEAYSAERSRDSLRSLMSLQPQEATVLNAHASEHDDDQSIHDHQAHTKHDEHSDHAQSSEPHDHQVIKPVGEVIVGDRVLVRPGQRIPVDGDIIKGISSINQAPVTGEEIPVVKQVGDEVMAGTVNGEAPIELRTSRPASEGTIARIARLVEQAQSQRSPAERFIDRFARVYTPSVVALAVLTVAIPVLLFDQPLLGSVDSEHGWLYRGLMLLIIACPCALVISIPVTVVSGMTRLAQLGVLVKSGEILDRMANVLTVCFDKTGTLTHGKPAVVSMKSIVCDHNSDDVIACAPCDDLLSAAASIERYSEHPVAHAIVNAARNRSGLGHMPHAENIQVSPGSGLSGIKTDCGHKITVGNADMFSQNESGWEKASLSAQKAKAAGQTMMYIKHNHKVVGHIGVQDEPREDSRNALIALGRLKPPVRRVMLTGDSAQAAKRIAAKLGNIDEVHSSLLPAEKLAQIERLQHNDTVAMVGDGINDAPALARADVGIAMGGGGTAQAMEISDVVLMQDNLSHVTMALRMARDCRKIVKQNIILSLGLKIAFLAFALLGIATLWMAVIADVGAMILVTLNGMRLLRKN